MADPTDVLAAEQTTDEQVAALYNLVKYAPTSMSPQPLRILVVRTKAARERLAGHMSKGSRVKIAAAPLTAVLAYDPAFHEPRGIDVARLNALIQVGYFILGVRALGLAADPMTDFGNEGMDREFFAASGYKSLVVATIGKPGENAWFPRDPGLEAQDVITTV